MNRYEVQVDQINNDGSEFLHTLELNAETITDAKVAAIKQIARLVSETGQYGKIEISSCKQIPLM